jgi:hypothetical protein
MRVEASARYCAGGVKAWWGLSGVEMEFPATRRLSRRAKASVSMIRKY